jgi:hypothetical protein
MDKKTKLAQRLVRKTLEGDLNWEQTEKEGVFQTSFPDHSLRVLKRPVSGPDRDEIIVIQIFDELGAVVEEIESSDVATGFSSNLSRGDLEKMYEEARKKAMNVEESLDRLIKYLDEDEPATS